jgi:hypothetical protein
VRVGAGTLRKWSGSTEGAPRAPNDDDTPGTTLRGTLEGNTEGRQPFHSTVL